jgi:hypothetical protein
LLDERDDAAARRRSRPVDRGLDDDAGDILAGTPLLGARLQ